MSKNDRSSSFMLLDCALCNVGNATASQLVLHISMLGREGHALPQFAFKNDIVVFLCTTQAQIQLKYMTALNDVECALEFEQRTQMVGVKRSLKQMENLLGMQQPLQCTMPTPMQLKILHHRNSYNDSTLTAPETQKIVRSQIEGPSQQMVEQLIWMLKREVREQTWDENHTTSLVTENNKVGTDSLSPSTHGFLGYDL